MWHSSSLFLLLSPRVNHEPPAGEGFSMALGRPVASWAPELSQRRSPRGCSRAGTGPARGVHSQQGRGAHPGPQPGYCAGAAVPSLLLLPSVLLHTLHHGTFAFPGLSSPFLRASAPRTHPNPSPFTCWLTRPRGRFQWNKEHALTDGRAALGMAGAFCE